MSAFDLQIVNLFFAKLLNQLANPNANALRADKHDITLTKVSGFYPFGSFGTSHLLIGILDGLKHPLQIALYFSGRNP